MTLWAIISTSVAILGLIFGIVRWIAARRKAKVDRELGEARAKSEAQAEGLDAAKERIKTDAAVTRLPDPVADERLDQWMRD